MSQRMVSTVGALAVVVASTACASSKSSNPLSPTIAGPIPGVNITAPQTVDPPSGASIAVDKQPLTLVVNNATTSGVRPLTYVFEVATDVDFNNKVFSREAIEPGGDGRTGLRLPDRLATGRSYYWRARAQDGANTGPNSGPANFNIFTPIVIDQPGLISPVNNVRIDSQQVRFTIANAPRSGPVGAVTYLIELSTNDIFSNKIAVWTVGEQPSQTNLDAPIRLAYSTQYFWHARAYDPTTTGPWSATQIFQTPAAPPPPPPPPPPAPISSGPAPNDMMNLGSATIVNSPADIASWPATTKINTLDLGTSGVFIDFSAKNTWPDVPFMVVGETLQYTLWLALNINGRWHASGIIQYWRGLQRAGGDVACGNQIAGNWVYDSRWGAMAGHQPVPGEQVGFFVAAGNARSNGTVVVKQRSNVVVVPFPGCGGNRVFTF